MSDAEDVEDIEIFFNNVKELDSIIRVLLRSARDRAVLRRGTRRNTVR
jgi:hypothetical protein